ncbi:Hypothetical predicted protein [Podarcis lilfordi]|uniref:Uncharacterized protein n=1 Tax=Podarcis lilfordi TaxID=74358 RepID=A0AA35P5B9_9SAUR|nr:Hypothetical predicted protein [Podarcis lilfordi]
MRARGSDGTLFQIDSSGQGNPDVHILLWIPWLIAKDSATCFKVLILHCAPANESLRAYLAEMFC